MRVRSCSLIGRTAPDLFLYYPRDLTQKGACENRLVVYVLVPIFGEKILIKKRSHSVHSSKESGIGQGQRRMNNFVNALFCVRQLPSIVAYYVSVRSYGEQF